MKQHATQCASLKPKYHGDARNQFPNAMGDCNCDGYHTFDELYAHRHALFIALLHRQQNKRPAAWKSRMHHDGTMFDGMFIAGIGEKAGEQITYHMPVRLYKELHVQSRQYAPEWDGHTPDDVVERLKKLHS